MKVNEIRNLSDAALEAAIQESAEMLAALRFNHLTTPIDNPSSIRVLRRDVARMKTIQAERKNQRG